MPLLLNFSKVPPFNNSIGWQLGSSSDVQVPTLSSNHLTQALLKYYTESGRLSEAARFLAPLFLEDLEVGTVLAHCLIGCGNFDLH